MEQGEYKVGLDTLFKILQVFDLKMGEFFEEAESEAEREERDLMKEFRGLSDIARTEVRDFVRFKQLQEQAEPHEEQGSAGRRTAMEHKKSLELERAEPNNERI